MVKKRTISGIIFDVFNYCLLTALALICILPMVHILAISLSDNAAASAGNIGLRPVNFTTAAYEWVMAKKEFWAAFLVSLKRLALGIPYHLIMTILVAYPLSYPASRLRGRSIYVGLLIFTMLFGGGLIPTYMLYKELHLLDTLWVLVVPNAVSAGNIMLMMNFFRNLPRELEESARIDGAGHLQILLRVILPVSLPSIATITLYVTVAHWNDYFSGMIFMNSAENYPLQTYVYNLVNQASSLTTNLNLGVGESWKLLAKVSDKTVRSAQIFITALPMLAIYPFLQKYYIKGIVVGSVKG